MKSSVIKRSIMLAGRRTSICLEDVFWKSLREIADARHETLSQLVTTIDSKRQHANLSSAVRLFVLGFYRDQCADYQSRPSEHIGANWPRSFGAFLLQPTPWPRRQAPKAALPCYRSELLKHRPWEALA